MSRSIHSSAQVPTDIQDESIATTLKVIMDVLKSHEGSIKELRHWLQRSSPSKVLPPSNGLALDSLEEPVKEGDNIPDNQSEVSSIMSSRTEYHELPTRSTVLNSTRMSATGNGHFSYVPDFSHDRTSVLSINGLTSTPSKPSPSSQHGFSEQTSSHELTPKHDLSVSAVKDNPHTPVELHKFSPYLQSGSYSVGALNNKIHMLESQMSEWGDIIDEMSDRMANQPSLIRKFAKESTTDKVSYRQYTEDLETLERKLMNRVDDKFAGVDRKIVELYDDVMSQVQSRGSDGKKKPKQDIAGKLNANVDSLTEQFDEQKEKLKQLSKGLSDLDGKVTHLKQDMTLYKRHFDKKRSDEELVSLVAEQLLSNEEIVGWKVALKEIHAALNKQSEINTSLHHSYATLDKRAEALSQKIQLQGRWRWSGVSNLYPRAHSCVTDQQPDDISFSSQIQNSEPRSFVWEKNKPYVVVTASGCYWVTVGAFSKKTGTPPSLQLTVDEEPVPLYNSSGKSPSHHRISVISSAPKYQPPPGKSKSEGISPWRPGSILVGAVIIPAHSRISVSPTSTAPGTRMSVEGYIELVRMY